MHRNIVKSSHFGRSKRYKNVIFKGINLKFCAHVYQYAPKSISFEILKNFQNLLKNQNFGDKIYT